jgi:hypothetical protein
MISFVRVLLLFNHALDVKKISGLQIIDFPTMGKGSKFTFGEVKIVGKGGRAMEVVLIDKQYRPFFKRMPVRIQQNRTRWETVCGACQRLGE